MEEKNFTKSLTLWGTMILTVLSVVLPALGYVDFANLLKEEQSGILDWLAALGSVISTAIIIYGRIRTTTKLTVKKT